MKTLSQILFNMKCPHPRSPDLSQCHLFRCVYGLRHYNCKFVLWSYIFVFPPFSFVFLDLAFFTTHEGGNPQTFISFNSNGILSIWCFRCEFPGVIYQGTFLGVPRVGSNRRTTEYSVCTQTNTFTDVVLQYQTTIVSRLGILIEENKHKFSLSHTKISRTSD